MKNKLSYPLKLLRLYTNLYTGHLSGLDELIFFVTYKCNFRCRTCFYADGMNIKSGSSQSELKIEEIRKISSSLGRLTTLYLSGGEPFFRNDLAEICSVFRGQNGVKNIYLPTNGFYTEKIFEGVRDILYKCPGMNLIVSLPLDGLKKTHDRIKGVPGSFEKVGESIKRLSALKEEYPNLSLFIITVISNENINEIIELCEFVKSSLPVDGHGPTPLRGLPHDKDLRGPTYEEWERLSPKLMEYHAYWSRMREKTGVKAILATNRVRYLYDLYGYVLKNGKMPFRCRAGDTIAVLEENGDVKLCELTEKIGNVRDGGYDIKKVLSSPQALRLRKSLDRCACTHACFLNPSIEMCPSALFRSYFLGRVK